MKGSRSQLYLGPRGTSGCMGAGFRTPWLIRLFDVWLGSVQSGHT